jgi:hypothetical protein
VPSRLSSLKPKITLIHLTPGVAAGDDLHFLNMGHCLAQIQISVHTAKAMDSLEHFIVIGLIADDPVVSNGDRGKRR